MNTDDPKLTAYALDELDPAERAEIEQLLRENADAAAEIEQTRAFAAQLRTRLKAEPAEPLHPAQRAEVLAATNAPAPVAPRKILLFSPKTAAWTALAASIAVGAGYALLLPTLHEMRPGRPSVETAMVNGGFLEKRDGSEVRITLGMQPAPMPEAPVAFGDLAEGLHPEPTPTSPRPIALGTLAPVSGPVTAPEPLLAGTKGDPNRAVLGWEAQPGVVRGFESKSGGNQPLDLSKAVADPMGREAKPTAKNPKSLATVSKLSVIATAASPAPDGGSTEYFAKAAGAHPTPDAPSAASAMAGRVGGLARGTDRLTVALKDNERTRTLSDSDGLAPFTREKRADDLVDMEQVLREVRPEAPGTESYDDVTDNPFMKPSVAPLSTFSIDVDTASYANARRFLNNNQLPPRASVRIEELINYFHYDYPQPDGDTPFSTAMEVATCPWAPEHRLLRVALHGREIQRAARPASNLVFLVDVSGSMQPENKLPLLKRSLALMVDQLSDRDQVSIVVYAGAAGCVLEATHSKDRIRSALSQLESGGSTHGSAGIQLAYELAEKHFIKGGTNRVLLATDGDWNVGVTDKGDLTGLIERKAKSGVFLTVLGFGMDNLKDDMLEKLADKGNGNYAYIDTLNEGRKVLVDELGATLITIAKDVKIQVEFNPAQIGAYRLIGYENRVMAAKDFADDTKDAGEIGAGHSVTALYELIPAGQEPPATTLNEELKYQKVAKVEPAPTVPALAVTDPASKELLTLKLRYKAPDGDKSTLREFPLTDSGHSFANSSRDFRFAAAVAGYGMLLRGSPNKGSANWELIHELATEGKGDDRDGYRAEFVGLVEKARALQR